MLLDNFFERFFQQYKKSYCTESIAHPELVRISGVCRIFFLLLRGEVLRPEASESSIFLGFGIERSENTDLIKKVF